MSTTNTTDTELRGGELKVWYIPQLGMEETFECRVPDLKTAHYVLETIYSLALFELENHIKPDFANTGGVVRYEVEFFGGGSEDFTGEWNDVDEYELEAAVSE